MNRFNKAFTLVELIVVITVLAILWTIWFISLQWYTKDSRNTVRLADVKTIKKTLSLHITTNNNYPEPDNPVDVSYSWATLWKQWTFWAWVRAKLKTISDIPLDPLFDNEYDYSVINKWNKFQLWTIMEWWWIFWGNNSLVKQSLAISNSEVSSYISWDYDYKDIHISTWSTCYNIATPSIIINSIWTNWELSLFSSYKFVYNKSKNMPVSYSWSIELTQTWSNFEIIEVYNKCSVDNMSDLEKYVDNLLLAYQQLDWEDEFEDIIYNSDNNRFKLNSAFKLRDDWLTIAQEVLTDLDLITPDNLFSDSFTWTFNNSSLWNWSTWVYSGVSDTLSKNSNSSNDTIFANITKTISDSNISFDIVNITWNIRIITNYLDTNNYYEVKFNTSQYQINQNNSWSLVQLTSIDDWVTDWDVINLVVKGNVIKFLINGVEKERLVATKIDGIWDTWINIENWWNRIDNFELYYR